jgi:hypothetical protein
MLMGLLEAEIQKRNIRLADVRAFARKLLPLEAAKIETW